MRNRFSKTFKLATVLFALPILAFLIAIVSSYSFSSSYQHSKAQNYFSNITMLYNKEGLLKSNIELPKSIHIKRGERLFLISEIPDWDSNELFLSFEVKNSNVKIFIDKQLFYEYSPKELAKINSNYGANYIVTKKIDAKYFGHEIILQFDPDLLINNHFILPQLNYGVSENILNTNYKDLSILIVNNIILICILFCLLIYFLLMKDKTTRLNLLSFLLLYLNLFFIFSILHSRIAVNLIPHPFLVAHLRPLIIATIPFCCIFFLSKAHNITTDLKTISLLRLTLLPSLIFYYGALLTKNQYLIFFASILQIVMQIEIILFLIFMIRKMEENPKYLKHALMILPLLITLDLISHFSYNIPNLINTSVILLPTVFAVTITAFSTNNYFKHSKVLLEKDLLRKLAYTDSLSGCFNRQAY